MMFMILSGLTIYKIIAIGPFIAPAAVLVTPFIYSLSNVMTEVYGYPVGRNMMWWFIISSAMLTLCSFVLIHLPSPSNFTEQHAFDIIFGTMPGVFVAGIIGSICGMSFNNYCVSKFKILMSGKKYWLRSIISTCGGEIIYNIIAYPIMFFSHTTLQQFFHILLCVTLFKITTTAIIWPFECLLARFLKIKEKVNIFDYDINYNLLNFKIASKPQKPNLALVKSDFIHGNN
jgi:uncharacterized integral membrane protein (TIGR00697 family)